jgi:para-nitrobenzyl esterase
VIHNGSQKAFLGLPYAAPPTGGLRWKPPRPALSWKGVRDATTFGARCEQWHVWDDYIFQDSGPSEDCLFVNVYAPVKAKPGSKLPVMVWIHGGGFIAGAGSEPRYSNSMLVDQGVVLVTLNYRLGVFGFLATDDLAAENSGHAGNYGLMDMVAALEWVHANIGVLRWRREQRHHLRRKRGLVRSERIDGRAQCSGPVPKGHRRKRRFIQRRHSYG